MRSVQGSYLKLFAEALAKMDSHYRGEAGRITAQLVVGMINSSEVIRGWASTALARRQMLAAARAAVGLE